MFDWVVATSAFLASAVDFVEAFTIVLVVGVTVNWRSALAGTALAVLVLEVLITIFSLTLVHAVPIPVLRLVVGTALILFGLKWLKKAIMRYSGRKAYHNEDEAFARKSAKVRAKGGVASIEFEPFGIMTAFNGVLIEGLEVAFVVVSFSNSVTVDGIVDSSIGGINSNALSAIVGATAAGLLVAISGTLIRKPLQRVPENTLKFVVGILLTSFGAFWAAQGVGISWGSQSLGVGWGYTKFGVGWWTAEWSLVGIIIFFLALSAILVQWLKPAKTRTAPIPTPENRPAPALEMASVSSEEKVV